MPTRKRRVSPVRARSDMRFESLERRLLLSVSSAELLALEQVLDDLAEAGVPPADVTTLEIDRVEGRAADYDFNPSDVFDFFGEAGGNAASGVGLEDALGSLPDLEGGEKAGGPAAETAPPDEVAAGGLGDALGNMPSLEGGDGSGPHTPASDGGLGEALGGLPGLEDAGPRQGTEASGGALADALAGMPKLEPDSSFGASSENGSASLSDGGFNPGEILGRFGEEAGGAASTDGLEDSLGGLPGLEDDASPDEPSGGLDPSQFQFTDLSQYEFFEGAPWDSSDVEGPISPWRIGGWDPTGLGAGSWEGPDDVAAGAAATPDSAVAGAEEASVGDAGFGSREGRHASDRPDLLELRTSRVDALDWIDAQARQRMLDPFSGGSAPESALGEADTLSPESVIDAFERRGGEEARNAEGDLRSRLDELPDFETGSDDTVGEEPAAAADAGFDPGRVTDSFAAHGGEGSEADPGLAGRLDRLPELEPNHADLWRSASPRLQHYLEDLRRNAQDDSFGDEAAPIGRHRH